MYKGIQNFSVVPSVIKEHLNYKLLHSEDGTAHLRNVSNCLNTNIYSYLETSGGKSYYLYLNAVRFFNTSVN